MRPTAAFLLYLVACLALGAALTYPLVQTGWLDYPPQRIMGRLAQLLALLGVWPFLKSMGLAGRGALGFRVAGWRLAVALGLGWVLGVLILLTLALALVGLGIRVPDPGVDSWPTLVERAAGALPGALLGGLLIGLAEETFFRGALFAAIRRRDGRVPAVVWSSLLYAVLHVMKPGALPPGVAFDAAGALAMVAGVFADVLQWRHLDTLGALFAVGVFLALVRERTGHIGWCIGLHAGWVLVIQTVRRVTDGNPDAPLAFLAGDYDGMIGWLAMAWIGILAWGYWRLSAPRTGGARD